MNYYDILLDSSEEYMIGREDAEQIIIEVKAGVRQWKSIATRLGIAKREMDMFEQVYNRFQFFSEHANKRGIIVR